MSLEAGENQEYDAREMAVKPRLGGGASELRTTAIASDVALRTRVEVVPTW